MSKKSAGRSRRFKFARPAVAFLIGPTASGKTGVLRELARRLPIEVINCDSMQVYRDLKILSQSPPRSLLKAVPHHEVGVVPVADDYSAARFVERASLLIPQILHRGRLPLVAGGTGLYAHALLDGLFEGPEAQVAVREALSRRVAAEGAPALHRELLAADPEAAAIIHPNDARRIIRALEVIAVAGEKFSDLKKKRKGIWGQWEVRVWGLEWDRAELYRRIDLRVTAMLRAGAVAEVRRLKQRPVSRTAASCLGLREIKGWLYEGDSREKMITDIQMNTRRYAKRQIAWWRRDDRVRWIARTSAESDREAAGRLAAEIGDWLQGTDALA